jgi:hypothetical protein
MFYGTEPYFKSGWNIMDGLLVVVSIIDLLMSLISESSPKIFGILRVSNLLYTHHTRKHYGTVDKVLSIHKVCTQITFIAAHLKRVKTIESYTSICVPPCIRVQCLTCCYKILCLRPSGLVNVFKLYYTSCSIACSAMHVRSCVHENNTPPLYGVRRFSDCSDR